MVIGTTRPVFSAAARKSSGHSSPRSGCSHRTSTSTPVMAPVAGLGLRLVVQHELSESSPARSSSDQGQSLDGVRVVARVVGALRVAVGLGDVQGDVGPLDQLLDAVRVLGQQRDADARSDMQGDRPRSNGVASTSIRRSERSCTIEVSVSAGQQHGELVAAEPGHGVPLADDRGQPRGHRAAAAGRRRGGRACR